MKDRYRQWAVVSLCGLMLICLILDGQTALQGALDGVEVCIYTVVPTLFPYIFLSSLLSSAMFGKRIALVRRLAVLCGVPEGAESIFLLGLIGGYPVGAKLIADCYRQGHLPKSAALRMLGFCSNAGPSFIFGILSLGFSKPMIAWILWLIHILSAVLAGILLPCKEKHSGCIGTSVPMNVSSALQQALKAVATICGWVILFKILLSFLSHWFLSRLPQAYQTAIAGILELTNGCIRLQDIANEAIRLPVAACLLAWGGLCVTMQTASVTKELGLGMYIPGKFLQTMISLVLSIPVSFLLYPSQISIGAIIYTIALFFVLFLATVYLRRHKKVVAIS